MAGKATQNISIFENEPNNKWILSFNTPALACHKTGQGITSDRQNGAGGPGDVCASWAPTIPSGVGHHGQRHG